MRLMFIILAGLLLSNCQSYVDKKTRINGTQDLKKFTEKFCNKSKSTKKKIYVCSNGLSKSLTISYNKSLLEGKLQLADILSSTLVKNESIYKKEDNKGITTSYESTGTSQIVEASVNGYVVEYKKVLRQDNKWNTFLVLSYRLDS